MSTAMFTASLALLPIVVAPDTVKVVAVTSVVVSLPGASVIAPVALISRVLLKFAASPSCSNSKVVTNILVATTDAVAAPLFAIVVAPRAPAAPYWMVPEVLPSFTKSNASMVRVPGPVSESEPALAPIRRAVPFSAARINTVPPAPAVMRAVGLALFNELRSILSATNDRSLDAVIAASVWSVNN